MWCDIIMHQGRHQGSDTTSLSGATDVLYVVDIAAVSYLFLPAMRQLCKEQRMHQKKNI